MYNTFSCLSSLVKLPFLIFGIIGIGYGFLVLIGGGPILNITQADVYERHLLYSFGIGGGSMVVLGVLTVVFESFEMKFFKKEYDERKAQEAQEWRNEIVEHILNGVFPNEHSIDEIITFSARDKAYDINGNYNHGITPLLAAAKKMNFKVFCHLLETYNLDIDKEDDNGRDISDYIEKMPIEKIKRQFQMYLNDRKAKGSNS